MSIEQHLLRLLDLPREDQVSAAFSLIDDLPSEQEEVWNSQFGPGSLFDAWTQTSIARGVHQQLADQIRPVIRTPGFVAIEVGAGDGRTWSSAWQGDERGTLIVIDPEREAIQRVAQTLPGCVELVALAMGVEHATLPEADLIVCSMTLHHRAGRSAAERAEHGMDGPGKLEILQAFRDSIRPRDGLALLVEADVDCELHLPPESPVLRDNIFDSYMRRCARSILDDLRTRNPEPDLRRAWLGLLHHWFLAQLRVADLPLPDRDVYELTVPQWLELLQRAELKVKHRSVDAWNLFHLYELR